MTNQTGVSILLILSYFTVIIPVLINVAFITLLERKILGLSQIRKSPSKVGMIGLLQPFSDAIKLFNKEFVMPLKSNKIMFMLSPFLVMMLSMLLWMTIPVNNSLSISMTFLMIYLVMSMGVYPLIMAGWSSNSNYASIGGLRGVAQTISYEVSFALIILFFSVVMTTFNLWTLMNSNEYFMKFLMFMPMAGLWFISSLAETNRTPFDFAEGESELVSGFNIEYGAVGFALIFMAEYANIYFMSHLFVLMFMSSSSFSLMSSMMTTMLVGVFVWCRTTFPRYRYDLLMNMAWFCFLPSTLSLMMYSMVMLI